MRSTFAGLNTMVGGINTNRLSLDTVGHNISNASTTGYSRQSVNQAATNAQEVYSIYGTQLVGTGVDSLSITRARNIYADKQYWKENGDNSYYTAQQTNYSKLEAIFNDSDDTGVENAMTKFYKAWSEVSTSPVLRRRVRPLSMPDRPSRIAFPQHRSRYSSRLLRTTMISSSM